MNPLGLSAEANERRRGYVTASDAKRVMEGDWATLWREKRGIDQPESLDDKLAVQIGSFTEPFNLWWYAHQCSGRYVDYYSDSPVARAVWKALTEREAKAEFVASDNHPWMGCSLDATSITSGGHPCVLDAKHVGQFRYDELVQRYTPAMTHQATVVGVDWWALSVFSGNSRWDLIEQEVDPFYQEELIAKEREFWSYVERNVEPPDMTAPTEPPKPQPRLRLIDMRAEMGSPEWQALVQAYNFLPEMKTLMDDFERTHAAATAHAITRESVKKLLPDTVGEIIGEHVRISRSRANAVTIALRKDEK